MHQFYTQSVQGKNSFFRVIGLTFLSFLPVLILSFPFSIYFVSAGYNPKTLTDPSINPTIFLLFNLSIFALLLLFFGLMFKFVHKRSFKTLITPKSKIDFKKIGFGFLLWFIFSVLSDLVNFIINPDLYAFNPTFSIEAFLPVLVIVVLFIPLQTSYEEIYMRGYLNQAFGRVFKYSWVALVLSSAIFASGHLANPEIAEYGYTVMLLTYFSMGLLLALTTLFTDSLEIAMGIHWANNTYGALFITYKSSVLQTPAFFVMDQSNPWIMFFMLVVIGSLSLWIISKKYPSGFTWKNLGKISFTPRPFFNKADSAVFQGVFATGRNSYFAQGTIIRSETETMRIGNESMILENSVVIGTKENPVRIGSKTILGHKTIVISAEIGDLCEIGNASLIMHGAKIGSWCIFGEGTYIPKNTVIPDFSVVVGKPGRTIRSLTKEDVKMITRMRGGNTELTSPEFKNVNGLSDKENKMGKLYPYFEKMPIVDATTILYESAEITGDVKVGSNCIIGAGVKIIGDSHGPIRIGNNVQILENTVLHLLPDNVLEIEDNVIIGPGCMIHGCKIGENSVIEPGVIVCDNSVLGKNSFVKAGSVVKQKSVFQDFALLEGFPAKEIGNSTTEEKPKWILRV